MPAPLDGRVAIVTGARSPIGRAIVIAFAEAGASVLATDQVPLDGSADGGGAANHPPDRIASRVNDLNDPDAAETIVAACIARFGRLDALVNVASTHMAAPLADVERTSWIEGITVNIGAPTFLAQAAAGHLEATDGCIILTGSNHARASSWNDIGYSASKSGLVGLTHSLATELGPRGIRVNTVTPGIVMATDGPADGDPQNWIPLRRTGRPDDVASVAVFLASDAAAYVTGQEIAVDGGQRAVLPEYAAIRATVENHRLERAKIRRTPRKRARRAVGQMLRKVGLRA